MEDTETLEQDLALTPQETGEDVRVEFFLYRENDPEPSRSLRLWLKYTPH